MKHERQFREWAMQHSGVLALVSALALLRFDSLAILYSSACGMVSGAIVSWRLCLMCTSK
jgi:hypothetical protein